MARSYRCILYLLFLVSCVFTPWVFADAPKGDEAAEKVIYGPDNRIDVYQEGDPRRRHWAEATCALVSAGSLQAQPDGSYTLVTQPYRFAGFSPCADEPFATQPTAPFCSGFAVGQDLIATAGHCYDVSSLNNVRFIFGFVMEDANTAVLHFSADQVYAGIEVVGREYTQTAADWTLVRLDRPIALAGFDPLRVRRQGVIADGTAVGVIGHPSGLPMKLAFGDTTVVRDGSPEGFFVANLDTYGGNSGSPVLAAATGTLEGILVRGATDFAIVGGCFRSQVHADTEGRGEDVTKATAFAHLVPELTTRQGTVEFLSDAVGCNGWGRVQVRDLDLASAPTVTIAVTTSEGDRETFDLFESMQGSGEFTGDFPAHVGVADPGNGTIEVNASSLVTVEYRDENDGSGLSRMVSDTVGVDCFTPAISGVASGDVTSHSARITFETDETATGRVLFGTDCASTVSFATGPAATAHVIDLAGLEEQTTYYFRIEATDLAGNTASRDNSGRCYTFTTGTRVDYLTEVFGAEDVDLNGLELSFLPTPDGQGYTLCVHPAPDRLESEGEGFTLDLQDDDSQGVSLPPEKTFPFFGVPYGEVNVGSNGFLTLGSTDTSWEPTAAVHFGKPRISMLFRDLNPTARGNISCVRNDQYITIDFEDVVDFDSSGQYEGKPGNTFQVRLYYNGVIRVVYRNALPGASIAGISPGAGVPLGFEPSDLSAAADCTLLENDMDGDGLPGGWEFEYGLDPYDGEGNNGPDADLDGDGLNNLEEFERGTDPRNTDSDRDGITDDVEVFVGLDPADGEGDEGALGDPDDDGLTNIFELAAGTHPRHWDSDRDGQSDLEEIWAGTDPTGRGEFHTADLDHDGRISLSELLRVVQLFRSRGYGCSNGSEDGYRPDGENRDCLPHHADFPPEDFTIDTRELLRMLQFHNAGEYGRDMYSEDSFAPMAWPSRP